MKQDKLGKGKDKDAQARPRKAASARKSAPRDEFVRAENEDDDGYDPYSDRPARREDLFVEDPWR